MPSEKKKTKQKKKKPPSLLTRLFGVKAQEPKHKRVPPKATARKPTPQKASGAETPPGRSPTREEAAKPAKLSMGKSVGGPPKERIKPQSPGKRTILEIQRLTGVGKKDPQRLAMMISNILGKEREKSTEQQTSFERKIQDLSRKRTKPEEDP